MAALGEEVRDHEPARLLCRRKEAAAANRKDAKLQYVVISEKWDK